MRAVRAIRRGVMSSSGGYQENCNEGEVESVSLLSTLSRHLADIAARIVVAIEQSAACRAALYRKQRRRAVYKSA